MHRVCLYLRTIVFLSVILYDTPSSKGFFAKNLHLWEYGIVYYDVAPELTPQMRRSVKYAIEYLSSVSCVKWVQKRPVDLNTPSYASFQYAYDDSPENPTCMANAGQLPDQQVILLGPYCIKMQPNEKLRHQVVMHEMMHTLGFFHEHQRPNRDCYIYVSPDLAHQPGVDIESPLLFVFYSDWPYDYESIMHYPATSGFYPRNPLQMLHRDDGKLSQFDIQKMKFLYCMGKSYCQQPGGQEECDLIAKAEKGNKNCKNPSG